MFYPKLLLSLTIVSVVLRTIQGNCYKRDIMKSEEDLKKIEKCPYLGVPLVISSDYEGKIILPVLDETHSNITITGGKITEINLENLTRAHVLNIIDVPSLHSLRISNLLKVDNLILRNIGGTITLNFNNGLEKIMHLEISNCSLKSINGLRITRIVNLKLNSLSGITRLELPHLSYIEGAIEVKNLYDLEAISFPKLNSIQDDAIFASNPKAMISLPGLKEVKSRLFFNQIKEIYIPELREVSELSFENVTSEIIKIHNLHFIGKHLHIINNENLLKLDLPLITEIKEDGITAKGNEQLYEISIPNLMFTRALRISAPKLTIFKYSCGLSGSASIADAPIECEAPTDTIFYNEICKNLNRSNVLESLSVKHDFDRKRISNQQNILTLYSKSTNHNYQQTPSLNEQNILTNASSINVNYP